MELVKNGFATSTSEESTSERRRPPPPRAAPWLMIPHGKGEKYQAFFNICEPQNRTCRKFIQEMSQKSYWQRPSHQGWLVMFCDNDKAKYSNCKYGDCFLWNPLSLEKIQLPSLLHWFKLEHHHIYDCVLSSPPRTTNKTHDDDDVDDDDDDNSMVFFLFKRLFNEIHEHVLVFCRPGIDKQWKTKELSADISADQRNVRSLLCTKGKLYVMTNVFWHLEIDIQLGHEDETQTLHARSFEVSQDTFYPTIGGQYCCTQTHYVESCDEIFMIEINYSLRGFLRVVVSIEISRLDFSLMAWEEVKSLGDHVLFIGKKTTASCSAAELGLSKGYLFYTLHGDQSLYIFDIEDCCTTVTLPCLKVPTPWFSPEWMMIPTSARDVDGRRRRIEDLLSIDNDNIMDAEESKTSMNDDEKDNQWQKENGRELEEATPWRLLTKDIIELIATYLHPVDYMHLRAVCKANRSVIPALYRKSIFSGIIKTTYISPWLLFSKNNGTIYNVVDPMHNNKKFPLNLSELLVGATIRFSKGGWLLMSKGDDILFFYNPFTKETIQLPDLQGAYVFAGISFSSVPTSSDCVVFAIDEYYEGRVRILSIARGDNVWRSGLYETPGYNEFMPCFNNPVFFDGAFYCLDYNGTLGVLNLKDGYSWKVLAKPQQQFNAVYPSFLVECHGKLLLVDLGHVGKSIGIFRLDFSKMVWVKVESLGNHMLFISNTSSLSAIAPYSHMENKIYFPRLHGEGILFYSLDTGRYHSIGSQHSATDIYDTREWLNSTWIEPNWLQTTKEELDWLSI